jgi:hypothetical protein
MQPPMVSQALCEQSARESRCRERSHSLTLRVSTMACGMYCALPQLICPPLSLSLDLQTGVVEARLARLLNYASSHGVDTVIDQFESREVCQRGVCAKRYDLDMPRGGVYGNGGDDGDIVDDEDDSGNDVEWADALGTVDERAEEARAWAALHRSIDPWARPVVQRAQAMAARATEAASAAAATTAAGGAAQPSPWVRLGRRGRRLWWWGGGAPRSADEQQQQQRQTVEVPAAGCVVSLPGARSQQVHRDGPKAGLINAFVPLVALTRENGATQLLPRTHTAVRPPVDPPCKPVAPLLRAGDLLLFDYRCLHHGLPNRSASARPVAYVLYSAPGVRDKHNFPADVSLRKYCERQAERNARLDATIAYFEDGRRAAAQLHERHAHGAAPALTLAATPAAIPAAPLPCGSGKEDTVEAAEAAGGGTEHEHETKSTAGAAAAGSSVDGRC